jgi:hypothetical protein
MYLGSRIDIEEITTVKETPIIQLEISAEMLRDMLYHAEVRSGYRPPSGKNLETEIRRFLRDAWERYSEDR